MTSRTFMNPSWGPWVLTSQLYWMSYKLLERRLVHLDITAAQARVIAFLYATGAPTKPSLVATALFQETQSITGIMSRLETRGWVRRQPDPIDRRAVGLDLTEEGREIASEVQRISLELYDELFARSISGAESRELVKTLRKIRASAFKLPETDFRLRRAREFALWSD